MNIERFVEGVGDTSPSMGEACDVASLLASAEEALYGDGNLLAARSRFDAAYRAAEAAGDRVAMGVAAAGLGGLWVHEHRGAAAWALVQGRIKTALAGLDAHSAVGLRLRLRLAAEADYHDGGHARILSLLEEARAHGDPVVCAEAASLAHHCVLGPDHAALRRQLAGELISEAVGTGRRSDLLMGLLWHTVDLFLDGDAHAERPLAELRGLLAERDHHAVGFAADAIDVMRSIRAGQLERAEAQARECVKRGERAGDVDAALWHVAQLVTIRWYQGRVHTLTPVLSTLVNSPTLSVVDNSCLGALAVAAAASGHDRQAAGALARLYRGDLAWLPRSSSWLAALYGAVEAANLLGERSFAAAAYDLLTPYADRPMMPSLAVACFGSVGHALGVAALTLDDPNAAVDHLRLAVRENLALAHWPATVLSRARLAEALTRRGDPGDAADARRERDDAERDAVGLGMRLPELSRRSAAGPWAAEKAQPATCRRVGKQWEISLGQRRLLVPHSRGMQYLAVLIANPGQEIAAMELAAGAPYADQPVRGAPSSGQPVLDDVAQREYRQRLATLQDEIVGYEARHETGRADQSRAEREWLLAELASAAGLGGRARTFATDDERARVAVGKAIRRALAYIEHSDGRIGRPLRDAVHTGLRCSYRPAGIV